MADPAQVTVKVHTDRWWLTLCGDCRYPLSVGVFFGARCPKCMATNPVKVNVVAENTITKLAAELDRQGEEMDAANKFKYPSTSAYVRALWDCTDRLRKLVEGRG